MQRADRSDPTTGDEVAGGPLAILFDVDGTLISTGGAGTRSWRWAFEELHGIPADIGEFSEAGMTDPTVARRTFRGVIGREPTERELARILAAYLERLPEEVETSEQYRVLPGAETLLGCLRDAGCLLGIVTGALEAAAHIKLARAGFDRSFAFGGYGSDSDDRGELTRRAIERAGAIVGRELDPASVYAVGDTPNDVEAARSVGAVAIGVASGHYSTDELRQAGAEIVLRSLEEPMPGLEWAWGAVSRVTRMGECDRAHALLDDARPPHRCAGCARAPPPGDCAHEGAWTADAPSSLPDGGNE